MTQNPIRFECNCFPNSKHFVNYYGTTQKSSSTHINRFWCTRFRFCFTMSENEIPEILDYMKLNLNMNMFFVDVILSSRNEFKIACQAGVQCSTSRMTTTEQKQVSTSTSHSMSSFWQSLCHKIDYFRKVVMMMWKLKTWCKIHA